MVRGIRWCARFAREPPAIHQHTSGVPKALVIEIEASNPRAFAVSMIRTRSGEELVELSAGGIALNLAVPLAPVMLHEPVAKFRELLGRELPDLLLNGLDFRHVVRF